jgi:autotransporter-associated beta strand protein
MSSAAVAALAPALAHGASGVWTNPAGGLWSLADTGNWAGGTVATDADALADFGTLNLTADATVNLAEPRTIGSLTFGDTDTTSAAGWTLANNATAANVLTLAGTAPTITVNALGGTKVATVSAIVAGTSGFTKAGAGQLTLSGANTYTGAVNVTGGTLRYTSPANMPTNGTFSLSNGATLQIDGSAAKTLTGIAFNGNGTYTAANGSSTVTVTNIAVASGATATINAHFRAALGGATSTTGGGTNTGSGTLNINVPSTNGSGLAASVNDSRTDINGNWTGFTGSINLFGTSTSTTFPSGLRLVANGSTFNNDWGNATVSMDAVAGGQMKLYPRFGSGNTLQIGALSGTSAAVIAPAVGAGPGTIAIGKLNTDTVFAGSIQNTVIVTPASTLVISLSKVGTGKLTLTSPNHTYTGTTSINAGTLKLDGAANLATSPTINIAGGATFDVSTATGYATAASQTVVSAAGATPANIAGNYNHAAGAITVGTLLGTGTLAFNGNLTLGGGAVNMELSPSLAPGGTNDYIAVTGTTALNGGTINLGLQGGLSVGTYTLLTSTGGFTGSAGNLTLNFGARGTPPALVVNGNALQLNVTSNAGASLVWTGSVDGNWNVNTTSNWLNAGSPDKFFQLDGVKFDNSATNFAVALVGSLAPNSVLVDNTTDYTFSGTGSINGSGQVTKKGGGKLTLNTTANNFTGGLRIEGGTVDALTTGGINLGLGTITLAGGTLRAVTPTGGNVTIANPINVTGSNTLVTANTSATARQTILAGAFSGSGTLSVVNEDLGSAKGFDIGSNMSAFAGTLSIGDQLVTRFSGVANGSPLMTLNISTGASVGTINSSPVVTQLAGLSGTGTLRGHASSGTGNTAEYRIGGASSTSTFDGTVIDGAQGATVLPVRITKTGTGTLTFNGANTYTGPTTVQGGTLVLGLAAQQPVLGGVTVTTPGGADLQGGRLVLKYDGITQAALVAQVASVLDAGYDQATKFSSGLLRATTLSGNQLVGWIDNSGSSQIEVALTLAGDFNLDGTVNFDDLLKLAANYNSSTDITWAKGDANYDGTVNFDDLLKLAANYNQTFAGSFAGDWSLARATVPEPTTVTCVGVALFGIVNGRRRRRRAIVR